MPNGLALHLYGVTEHREGYLSCGGLPRGVRGPRLGFQYQEEESP